MPTPHEWFGFRPRTSAKCYYWHERRRYLFLMCPSNFL
jgi:hypothetical protein